MTKARLTILAGPTAVDEGAVVAALMKRYPTLNVSISAATRDPRPGELNGVRYYLVSTQKFDAMIGCGGMLEWALAHGNNKYGTPHGPVDKALAVGKPVLLGIDLTGARQVRTNRPDVQFIFLAPPSQEKLERHLIGRGTEGPEERTCRLTTARIELEAVSEFDHAVISGGVERAVGELVRLIGPEQYLSESATERSTRMSRIVTQPVDITPPPIDDLLEHVDSRYTLVIFTAKRVRQTNSCNLQLRQSMIQSVGPVVDVQPDEKPLMVSLCEINEGLLSLETNPEA